jgi:hypothetical protein
MKSLNFIWENLHVSFIYEGWLFWVNYSWFIVFLSAFQMYYPTLSWLSKFLLRNTLVVLWSFFVCEEPVLYHCFLNFLLLFIHLFILVGLGFELRAPTTYLSHTSKGSNYQCILFWLFWRWGLVNYLPGLATGLSGHALKSLKSWVK